nr:MAG TPA: hypothetical protein [Crassvirales sp.]
MVRLKVLIIAIINSNIFLKHNKSFEYYKKYQYLLLTIIYVFLLMRYEKHLDFLQVIVYNYFL